MTTKTEQDVEARNKLRASLLGTPAQFSRKLIKYYPPLFSDLIDENTGEVIGQHITGIKEHAINVEVRQASVGERNSIISKCRDKDGNLDITKFMVEILLACVYVPGTDLLLFEREDVATLMNLPAGGFYDDFSTAASELMNVGGDSEKNSPNSEGIKTDKQP